MEQASFPSSSVKLSSYSRIILSSFKNAFAHLDALTLDLLKNPLMKMVLLTNEEAKNSRKQVTYLM